MTHTGNNELTSTPGPGFLVGEMVDVTIRGARVVDNLAAGWLALDVAPGFTPSVDTRASAVTVTRMAPPEWPPQPADVWRDRNGLIWAALGDTAVDEFFIEMRCTSDRRGDWQDPSEVLAAVGPMRLEYRPGWTRQPDPVPAGPADVDKRTANVAGLRALADFLEANPDLSEAYGFHGQINAEDDDHVRQLAQRFGTTITEDADNNQLRTEVSFAGSVRFTVVHFRPKPAALVVDEPLVDERGDAEKTQQVEDDVAERRAFEAERAVEEPTQALQLVIADGGNGPAGLIAVAPVDDPAGEGDDRCDSAWSVGVGGEHKCELYGTHPEADHVCLCGTTWENALRGNVDPVTGLTGGGYVGDDRPVPAQRDAAE